MVLVNLLSQVYYNEPWVGSVENNFLMELGEN